MDPYNSWKVTAEILATCIYTHNVNIFYSLANILQLDCVMSAKVGHVEATKYRDVWGKRWKNSCNALETHANTMKLLPNKEGAFYKHTALHLYTKRGELKWKKKNKNVKAKEGCP